MGFGGAKPPSPPPMPPALPTRVEIGAEAMKVGETERRRLRRGRASTILTGRRLEPAQTTSAGLKQTLG